MVGEAASKTILHIPYFYVAFSMFFYYSLQSISIYNIHQLFETYYLIENSTIILKQLRSSKASQLKSQILNKRKVQISVKLTEAPKDLLPVTLEIIVEKGIQTP